MTPRPLPLCRALVRWQHAAGPYWPYVCATPFLGQIDPDPVELEPAGAAAAFLHALGPAAPNQGVAVFVDLPPQETLPAAPSLRRRGSTVVPIIQRWIEPNSLLAGGPLLKCLDAYSPRGFRPSAGNEVVFLLDSDRSGATVGATDSSPRARFDNRYAYPVCRFPPAEFLKTQKVVEVHWLSRAAGAADLIEYKQLLAEAGLPQQEIILPPRIS
jgi:hypothetical protein